MSIAGIAASSFFSGAIAQSSQAKFKQAQHEFQKLGQDLQAGNLGQAQTDLAALQKEFPGSHGAVPGAAQSGSGVAGSRFRQLGQDLQAGNLAAAQSDYANLRQDSPAGSGPTIHPHRHPRHGEDSATSPNGIAQVLSQLGQALQSNNLSAAQQSYTTLLQDFQQPGTVSAPNVGIAPTLARRGERSGLGES